MDDLVGYAVTGTTADPIPRSVCRVAKASAARGGYDVVGICLHCTDAVIPSPAVQVWVHRGTGILSCLASQAREWDVTTGRPAAIHRS